MKLFAGSSALMRSSIAQPRGATSSWRTASGSPPAIRNCSAIRSTPVIASVTGCSTWIRVFISMKKNSSLAASTRNSTVPALR
jgi:hypothetical protein